MKCCGKERRTPCCPMCGAKLREAGPLGDLQEHCRKTRDHLRKRLEDAKDCSHDSYLTSVKRSLQRWEERTKALEELIARNGRSKP